MFIGQAPFFCGFKMISQDRGLVDAFALIFQESKSQLAMRDLRTERINIK
jgi:hypothetical protein